MRSKIDFINQTLCLQGDILGEKLTPGEGNYWVDQGHHHTCTHCGKRLWRTHSQKKDRLECRNDRCFKFKTLQGYVRVSN
jgi:hypothetical protein